MFKLCVEKNETLSLKDLKIDSRREKVKKRVLDFFKNNEEFKLLSDIKKINKILDRIKIRHNVCGTIFKPTIDRFLNKGTRCPNKSCKIKRIKNTHVERYGFDVVFKSKDFLKKRSEKVMYQKYLELAEDKEYAPLFTFENYKGIGLSSEYKQYLFECRKCGHKIKSFLSACRKPVCRKCYPVFGGISAQEKEVVLFLNEMGISDIVENDKQVLNEGGKEIDILSLENKIGIEYNGLIWHSEKFKTKAAARTHMLKKTKLCEDKGLSLIHIFSDEWLNNQDIVKSILRHAFKKTANKISARKCKVVEDYDKNKVIDFLNQNHISGNTNFIKSFSLLYRSEIVSTLTTRKPFTGKYKNSIEIARFCTKTNYLINGGFSRLIKRVSKHYKENSFSGILTYSDRRFGSGSVYERNGFTLIGQTKPDYYYTDGLKRFNRFKYRAQNGKTEREVAKINKVYKVYGCGNNIYYLSLE